MIILLFINNDDDDDDDDDNNNNNNNNNLSTNDQLSAKLLVKQQKGSKVWEDSIHKLEFHEPKLKNI